MAPLRRDRAPDPWYNVTHDLIVRRLAPDSRKLEFDGAVRKLSRRLLGAMAHELANIHRADPASAAIEADLAKRKKRWLERSWPSEYGGAEMSPRAANVVREEFGRRRAGSQTQDAA